MNNGTGFGQASRDDNEARENVSLCEALDRVLNKGAVVVGELTISVADVDLVYLSLQLILTSVETARRELGSAGLAGSLLRDNAGVGGRNSGQ